MQISGERTPSPSTPSRRASQHRMERKGPARKGSTSPATPSPRGGGILWGLLQPFGNQVHSVQSSLHCTDGRICYRTRGGGLSRKPPASNVHICRDFWATRIRRKVPYPPFSPGGGRLNLILLVTVKCLPSWLPSWQIVRLLTPSKARGQVALISQPYLTPRGGPFPPPGLSGIGGQQKGWKRSWFTIQTLVWTTRRLPTSWPLSDPDLVFGDGYSEK